MSSLSLSDDEIKEKKMQVVFENYESIASEEPTMADWSSLDIVIPEDQKKKILYDEGLYSPGSGEICAKYLAQSDSAMLRHPFFNYPSVQDPGIVAALMTDDFDVQYSDDGQDLYLATCKEMWQHPVRMFHKALLGPVINLSHYGVNPASVRAMTIALANNNNVQSLIFTDNFLNEDACFHIGQLLKENYTITELNLSGCRVGPEGIRRIVTGLRANATLIMLNLDKNKLGDEGGNLLASAIYTGISIKELSLRYNDLGATTATGLAEAFDTNNRLKKLDLSWNKFFTPGPMINLLNVLSQNDNLEELLLSWNGLAGPRVGQGIANLMIAPNLTHLDLSNNRLTEEAITSIAEKMKVAKKLVTLNLSSNPLSQEDVLKLMRNVTSAVNLKRLFLDNILVNDEFIDIRNRVLETKSVQITHGNLISKHVGPAPDPRLLVLKRVDYILLKTPKKNRTDIVIVASTLLKENVNMVSTKNFPNILRRFGGSLDNDLVEELSIVFPGPRTAKFKNIDIKLLVEYAQRLWPDRKLPPTPPPEPEPEIVKPKTKGKKGKAKKGKKK